MEYQKKKTSLDNTPNQATKFRTKDWVVLNDDGRGTYNRDSRIEFKTSMLKSSLCDYSDAYILVKGTLSITTEEGDNLNNRGKELIFKSCAPFTDSICEINNTHR